MNETKESLLEKPSDPSEEINKPIEPVKASGETPQPERAKPIAKKVEKAEKPEEPPSPLQPLLDRFSCIIRENRTEEVIREAFVNRVGSPISTFVVEANGWNESAKLLRDHPEMQFNYLQNCSCVDYQTHFEMVFHLYSFEKNHSICVRVVLDRENPQIPSVCDVWQAANWCERECYDLFGIQFKDHSDLRRILLPDNWEGYPLRKDYVALDKEV